MAVERVREEGILSLDLVKSPKDHMIAKNHVITKVRVSLPPAVLATMLHVYTICLLSNYVPDMKLQRKKNVLKFETYLVAI